MPLIKPETGIDFTLGDDAVSFWMTVKGANPVEPIRVVVPYSTLERIDPFQPRDRQAAADTFTANRELIESAASTKFDKEGVNDGNYQSHPILIVSSEDLP